MHVYSSIAMSICSLEFPTPTCTHDCSFGIKEQHQKDALRQRVTRPSAEHWAYLQHGRIFCNQGNNKVSQSVVSLVPIEAAPAGLRVALVPVLPIRVLQHSVLRVRIRRLSDAKMSALQERIGHADRESHTSWVTTCTPGDIRCANDN